MQIFTRKSTKLQALSNVYVFRKHLNTQYLRNDTKFKHILEKYLHSDSTNILSEAFQIFTQYHRHMHPVCK